MKRQQSTRAFSFSGNDIPYLLLSVLVLLTCAYYFFLYLQRPNVGFLLHPGTWQVTIVSEPDCVAGDECIQVGDQLLRIGDLERSEAHSLLSRSVYEPFRVPGAAVSIELERDGQRIRTAVRALEGLRKEPIHNFIAALFPGMFWLTGTLALILIRPRDERWWVLVLLLYCTAIWGAAGFVSSTNFGYSSLVLATFLIVFMPLLVHLHLVLPYCPSPRLKAWLLPPTYAAALGLVMLRWIASMPWVVLTCVLLATCLSMGLLFLRLFLRTTPANQVAHRVMVFGASLGLGPTIVAVAVTRFFPQAKLPEVYSAMVSAVAMVVVPMWPISYIYAIYKRDSGSIRLRANRVLGAYGFLAMYILIYLVAHGVISSLGLERLEEPAQAFVVVNLALSLVLVGSAPAMRQRFQRVVDRHVFGVRRTPEELLGAMAERIPAAFNRDGLRRVVREEMLPALLIRQSALYVVDGEEVEVIYEQEVPEQDRSPDRKRLEQWLQQAGGYLPTHQNSNRRSPWVRLVVPLSIGERNIGAWIFGQRDPDDFYSPLDEQLFINLGNQIAPVIEHVRLVETAKREVQQNRQLQRQLVQSQKMEAIGRLSAGVAHDFNNLLSVILGYGDLLLARHEQDGTTRRHLENICDAGQRAAALTRQLLTFSRQQLMEPRVVNLNSLVEGVQGLAQRLAGEDVELSMSLCPDIENVRVDPGQIEQVLLNLTVNARDAMPDGGHLHLRTRMAQRHENDDVSTQGEVSRHSDLPVGSYVQLRVADSGCGIDPEDLEHIFEPFFTTKEVGKGTGLGLAMVYGIISQSGGYIFVDTEPGLGTRFHLYFPAVAEPCTVNDNISRPPAHRKRATETILVVEDEEVVRNVACEILRSEGYRVLRACNGREALFLSENHNGDISLLLTDVVMPWIKGPDLALQLRRHRPELKILYMSGYSEEALTGYTDGDEEPALIRKPFPPNQLAEQVRRLLDRKAPQRVVRQSDKTLSG